MEIEELGITQKDNSHDSGDDEESMTAAELLSKIEELWITEKMSPTLEPHHSELIDCMLDQLSQMTNNLKKCKKNDFRVAIHKLEIDRIRYIISSYLRTRLKKIERFSHYLIEAESKRLQTKPPILSPEEHTYLKKYIFDLDDHLNTLVCQHMPENLRSIEKVMSSVKPNLESYVFFKVKKSVNGLLIEDNSGEGRDEEVDLIENQQHLMKYDTIRDILNEGSVTLI